MNPLHVAGWTRVLSLLTGTPRHEIDPQHKAPRKTTPSTAAAPAGFAIDGDGFYVWDEERCEAEDWAIELAGPAFPPRRS